MTTRRAPPQLVPMTTALALISLGPPIGFLIDPIGIGGVLLTPALVHLFGRDIHESVSLSLASFVLAGMVDAMRVATEDARLRVGDWIFLAAIIPAALVGVLLAPVIPKASLSLIVSACVAFAGFSSSRKPSSQPVRLAGSAWSPAFYRSSAGPAVR